MKESFSKLLLATFFEKPAGIRFQDQHKTENIMILVRKHWVTNVGWILVSLFLLFLPVFGVPFIDITKYFVSVPFGLILAAIAFWYTGTFGFILMNFLFWFYNVGIVTNERIIDVDYVYLLYSEITEAIIKKVEDVTNKTGGFLSMFFDYGNVFVQTAGTEANIEFEAIPKPATIVKIITELLQEAPR